MEILNITRAFVELTTERVVAASLILLSVGDRPVLSCPGSSEVAEIKSFEVTERGGFPLAQDLPEVDQL